jgi:hypothetical protein
MSAVMLELFEDAEAARRRLSEAAIGDEARGIVEDSVAATGGDLVAVSRALAAGGLVRDAAAVLAQALARPAAVWWACRAALGEPGGGPTDKERPAVEAAEAWLRDRQQWRAYAANDAAKACGMASPAGCAALAAFLAGESMAPSHLEPLPPPSHLAGMAVVAAIELAATRRPSHIGADVWQELLERGWKIAAGEDSWLEEPLERPEAARS